MTHHLLVANVAETHRILLHVPGSFSISAVVWTTFPALVVAEVDKLVALIADTYLSL
jgi:hypothetical protein